MFKSNSRGRNKKDMDKKAKFTGHPKKKVCKLCLEKASSLDYKDVKKLERYVSDRGKLLNVRITGNCAKHQRLVRRTVNRARFLALMPHIKTV